jgi:hypothetical protein
MRIKIDFSGAAKTNWRDYAVRFLFGGAITMAAGLLAKQYGPVFGGLFLAFPAIFPASATLIEKHEREKKRRSGISKSRRGRQAAALDARGASLGSFGLVAFSLLVWKILPNWNAVLTLVAALVLWLAISVLSWRFRKGLNFFSHFRIT